jgi:hypothetical protein
LCLLNPNLSRIIDIDGYKTPFKQVKNKKETTQEKLKNLIGSISIFIVNKYNFLN